MPSAKGLHSASQREDAGGDFSLSSYLPFRLGTLSQRLLREASLIYKRTRQPLTAPQWMVLSIIANYRPLVASEISRISLIDEVGVSRAVSSLEQLGLVTRERSRQDQRVMEISLTVGGESLYGELATKMEAQQALVRTLLTQEEFRMFLGLVDRLDMALNSIADLRNTYGDTADVSEAFTSALPPGIVRFEADAKPVEQPANIAGRRR